MDGNGQNPTQAAPSSEIKMVIYYDQMNGACRVEGPINNGMVAYGMLEMAKQAVQQHILASAGDKRILPANTLPMIRH